MTHRKLSKAEVKLRDLRKKLKITKPSREFFPCVCRDDNAHVPTLGVVHQTQGPTEESAARYLETREDGSAHLCVDWDSAHRIADDEDVVCGVGGANTGTWHLEMAGYSSWKRNIWLLPNNVKMMKRAAFYLAQFLVEHELPANFVTVAELDGLTSLRHARGFTTHANLSRSNKSTSTHTDPGLGWPKRWFHRKVRRYRALIAAARKESP